MISIFDCCDIYFADFDICLLAQLYISKFLFKEHLSGLLLQQCCFSLYFCMDFPFAALQLHSMCLEFLPASLYSTWTSYSVSSLISCNTSFHHALGKYKSWVVSHQVLYKAPNGDVQPWWSALAVATALPCVRAAVSCVMLDASFWCVLCLLG